MCRTGFSTVNTKYEEKINMLNMFPNVIQGKQGKSFDLLQYLDFLLFVLKFRNLDS